jgi:hypothetical protein
MWPLKFRIPEGVKGLAEIQRKWAKTGHRDPKKVAEDRGMLGGHSNDQVYVHSEDYKHTCGQERFFSNS